MTATSHTIAAPRSRKPSAFNGNLEKAGWLFMRISGFVLVILIFGHLIVNLVLGEGVRAIDFAFVAGKWASPFWQVWDVIMLWLALIHGTNGMRTIVNDYASSKPVRIVFKSALFASAVILIVLGTLVIFTFDPCPQVPADQLSLLPSFCPAQ